MQGRAVEAAGTTASADAADADIRVNDDRVAAGNRRQYPTTHTEQAGRRPTALLAPDDPARVSTGRAGTDCHIASAAVDATVDAIDRATRNQHRRAERQAGAMRAL